MSGVKGKSGRRKEPTTLISEALKRNDANVVDYLSELSKIAMNNSIPRLSTKERIDALQYLINRSLGTPKAKLETEIKLPPDTILPGIAFIIANASREQQYMIQSNIKQLEGSNTSGGGEGASGGSNTSNGAISQPDSEGFTAQEGA